MSRAWTPIIDTACAPARLMRLRLGIAAVQHPFGNRVGHLDQQPVTLLPGHLAVVDQASEQDLDVDLVV